MKKYSLLLLLFLAHVSYSQVTYTFTGAGYWSQPSNWANNIIPPPVLPGGCTVFISPAPGDTCILNVYQTILQGAGLIVSPGARFIVLGNLTTDSIPSPSARLVNAFEIDTTLAAPSDTIKRWTLTYDNLNRLVTDSFSNRNSNSTYYAVIRFEYAGNETLAYRKTRKSYNSIAPASIQYDTTYCYFVNNKYVRDSVIFNYGVGQSRVTAKTAFEYGDEFIIRNFQNWIPEFSYSATEYAKIRQVVDNGKIIYQIDTTLSKVNGQPSGEQVFETTVSYLPNPNPFYKVVFPAHKAFFNYPGIGNVVTEDYSYAPEFLISQQTSSFGNVSYDYTFRPDGLPLKANVTSTDTGGNVKKSKLLFVYAQ